MTVMSQPRPISETQLALFKPFMRCFTRLNVLAYKCSGGLVMGHFMGRPICLVRMTGAKSGLSREIPLMYVPYEDGVILVASMGGAPRHPTWYYNLLAHPRIEVTVGSKRMALVAHLASAEEKARVWPLCVEHYPDYALYQQRTERDIPVFICRPED